jgi:predicted PurR-regulated permease PerM
VPADGSGESPNPSTQPATTSPPVIVESGTPSWLAQLPVMLGYVLETLARAGLAIVLTVFILLRREDLRNRFIRLVGHGRITVTTKAVDDAASGLADTC